MLHQMQFLQRIVHLNNTMFIVYLVGKQLVVTNRGVQYVRCVMHKCIMVKSTGETKYT